LGLGLWLKLLSTCLASTRYWLQILVLL
jgi:hypothetical protein